MRRKVPKKAAQSIRVKIEEIIASKITGQPVNDEVSRWLSSLEDVLYDRIAAVDLVKPRASSRLGEWLKRYIDQKKVELKPASIAKLEQTRTKLLGFFDEEISLRKITIDMAAEWRQWLTEQDISIATVNTHCGNAKTLLQGAVQREIISRNPFASLSGGRVAAKMPYIDEETIEKVIEACPDAEWRLLFGLTRYAGLRCPSETHLLTWADVDWEGRRLHVRSPKTERFAGKDRREVPICPRLMELLQERFDMAVEGEEHPVAKKGKGAVQRQVRAICNRAGVGLWPRLWQTLRASCEQWWAMDYPQYAVSNWIGHSITVSGKHYTNSVPEELFTKATEQATQNPTQHMSKTGHNAPQPKTAANDENAFCGGLQHNQEIENCLQNGAGGSRTPVP